MANRFRIPVFARIIFLVAGILLFLMLALLCYADDDELLQNAQRDEHQSICDAELWKYVYNPGRLEIKNPCIRVTGEIRGIRKEKDGDYHILVRLDPQYRYLLNNENKKRQNGNLVVEPVCQIKVALEKPKAKDACKGFPESKIMDIPEGGTRVVIVGSYVFDSHHGWMEIHPATVIAPLQ